MHVLKLQKSRFRSIGYSQYARGQLRADPWQAILTIISLGVTIIVGSFRHDFDSIASIAIIFGSLGIALWRPRFPTQGLLAQIGLLSVALAFSERYGSLCLALAFFAVLVVLDDDSDDCILPTIDTEGRTLEGVDRKSKDFVPAMGAAADD